MHVETLGHVSLQLKSAFNGTSYVHSTSKEATDNTKKIILKKSSSDVTRYFSVNYWDLLKKSVMVLRRHV